MLPVWLFTGDDFSHHAYLNLPVIRARAYVVGWWVGGAITQQVLLTRAHRHPFNASD